MIENNWINYDQVVEVAEVLLTNNENPTALRVREYLGRGSNTTIQKYLNQWKKTRPKSTATPPDPVNMAVKQVWDKIHTETQAEIDKIKAEFEQATITATQKINALDEERAYFAQEWHNTKQVLQNMTDERNNFAQLLQKTDQALALSKTKEALLTQSHQELATVHEASIKTLQTTHQNEIQSLNHQLQLTREQAKASLDQLIATHEAQRHQWLAERENLKANQLRLGTQLEGLEKALSEKTLLVAGLKEELKSQRQQSLVLEKTNAQLETELNFQKKALQGALDHQNKVEKLLDEERQYRLIQQKNHECTIRELAQLRKNILDFSNS